MNGISSGKKWLCPPPEKILATGLGGALIESRKGCPVPCLFYFNCSVSYGPSLGILYLLICCLCADLGSDSLDLLAGRYEVLLPLLS